jgi:putative ABC transport system ATP-binding protein
MSQPSDLASDLAVQIRHLNYFFGQGDLRKQVLHDINLDLPKGQIVIMTGPSGSGKTTLLTLIGALRFLQEGSLTVLGQELVGLSKSSLVEVRRNIGFIFQAHNLFESLTASQNVEMAIEVLEHWGSKRKQAVEMLSQLGLGERVDYKPKALSGGQKQRVAIARALVNQPSLILADEPTAALDQKSGRHVVTLMQKLAKERGCTILMVTHDNRILDVADRIVNLVDGHLESDQNFATFQQTHDPKALV